MIKVAMIVRSTLYTVRGGDTIQAIQTARMLDGQGISVDIKLTDESINYANYSLLHFFNITRPADILHHIRKIDIPFVVSTIMIDYSEYDKFHRKGLPGMIFRYLSGDTIEYMKAISRWITGKDKLMSYSYVWKGQKKSILEIIKKARLILPNSASEYARLKELYGCQTACIIVPNAVDADLFRYDIQVRKDPNLVLCIARIEGIKNQANLIRALNKTKFRLILIGAAAPNQQSYYQMCRNMASANIQFIDQIPQEELVEFYQKAKVHVLPSWFETTGLSSLEAASMGCNLVITDKGDTREYFGSHAIYCSPESPESIYAAVLKASILPCNSETSKNNFRTIYLATGRLAYRSRVQNNHEIMGLKIAILGTRGVPNHYGGFEHIAGYLARGLMERGHELTVYNSSRHPYREREWQGVQIVHCYDPEYLIGVPGQFIYDLNCILDARKKNYDVMLMLGYTSSSIWGFLYPGKPIVITNMDGLEWQRTKYTKPVRGFLKFAEKLAVNSSRFHVADSPVIKEYLDAKYNINSKYIGYGSSLYPAADENLLEEYGLEKNRYFLLMARMEPENNVEMILDGYLLSGSKTKFVVIGNTGNRFGKYLTEKYKNESHIVFLGAIFHELKVRSITAFCTIVFPWTQRRGH